MWQPTNICELLSPVFKVWKFTALPIFTLKYFANERKLICSKAKTWHLGMLTIGGASVYFMYQRMSVSYTDLVISTQNGFLTVQNIFAIYMIHKKKYQLESVIAKFTKIEHTLCKVTKIQINCNRIAAHLLKFVIMRYTFALISLIMDCISEPRYKFCVAFFHISWNYQFHFDLVLFTLFLFLKSCYIVLKDYIRQNEFSLILNNHSLIVDMCGHLDDIVADLNKIFQEIILVKAAAECFCTTIGVYYSILTVPRLEFALTATAIFYLIVQAAADFSIIYFFQAAFDQVLVSFYF
jgi:hypothetical protein